jgi:dienelactone hydrolase
MISAFSIGQGAFLIGRSRGKSDRWGRPLLPHLDDVVPAFEGKTIYDNLKKQKRFELIKRADHAFAHPSHRERAATLSLPRLARYLREWFGQERNDFGFGNAFRV